jgi:hypothetical protein
MAVIASFSHCTKFIGQLIMPSSGIREYWSAPATSKSFVFRRMTRSMTSKLLQVCQYMPQDLAARYMYSQSSKRHSGAPMLAPSKAHMCCRIWPTHDEFIRVIENIWIAVGGCVAQCDRFSWSDCFSVEMHVFGSRACESSIWAIQSEELFHC